jgi:hypothetical protein
MMGPLARRLPHCKVRSHIQDEGSASMKPRAISSFARGCSTGTGGASSMQGGSDFYGLSNGKTDGPVHEFSPRLRQLFRTLCAAGMGYRRDVLVISDQSYPADRVNLSGLPETGLPDKLPVLHRGIVRGIVACPGKGQSPCSVNGGCGSAMLLFRVHDSKSGCGGGLSVHG